MPAAARRLQALEDTRDRILAAAREVVAAEGWQGAQVALIAARAKVATGSVYRHFASKADLYTRVLSTGSQREVEILRGIAERPGPAAERLSTMITTFVRRAMKSPRLAYALIAEPCEPEIDAARLEYRAAIAEQFARVVKSGVASGEFVAVDPALAASCVAGAFFECMVVHLGPDAKPESKAGDRMAAAIAKLCVRMVGKP
jgi:AcrR family transcriptional regulator